MIPTLRTNKAILDDFKKYQEAIDKIDDDALKAELSSQLRQLREQVGHIDRNHEQLLISGRIPTEIGDIRTTIISIKKSMDSKIDIWNKSKFAVKPEPHPNEE